MYSSEDDAIAEIRSRADLEIELARLDLRLRRAAAHVVRGATPDGAEERRIALVEWFDSIADEILSRTGSSLKPYARSRIAIIAARCPTLDGPAADLTDDLPQRDTPMLHGVRRRLDRHTR